MLDNVFFLSTHVSSRLCSQLGSFLLQGMELYPRIGKNFDIKVFTNCRFGMMSWAVLAVTYCIKQVEALSYFRF